MIERTTSSRIKVPISHAIMYANTKSDEEITNEIRQIRQRNVEEKNQFVESSPSWALKVFHLIPKFIRKAIIKKKASDVEFFIKCSGTVGITSVGMFSKNFSGWGIPFTASSLDIAVGGIKSKPVLINEKLEEHEFLNLTVQFDHNIVDGAPTTRFVSTLSK